MSSNIFLIGALILDCQGCQLMSSLNQRNDFPADLIVMKHF